MTGKFFNDIKTLAELKRTYKELARKFHPDLGGDVEVMQQINAEYDKMIEYFAKHGDKKEQEKAKAEVPEKFRKIIAELIRMEFVQIEIVGSWIWLSGNVGKYLRKIKGMGFEYSSKQKKYYLSGDDNAGKCRASHYSFQDLREIYGSDVIESEGTKALA